MMVFALILLVSVAVLGQVYLQDIYMLMYVFKSQRISDSNFLEEAQRGIRGFEVAMLFFYLEIWAIKLNFLLFFRRLVIKMISYLRFCLILWWVVLIIIIACEAINIGVMQFRCMFDSINHIMFVCSLYSTLRQIYIFFKLSCILNMISDVLSKLIRIYQHQ